MWDWWHTYEKLRKARNEFKELDMQVMCLSDGQAMVDMENGTLKIQVKELRGSLIAATTAVQQLTAKPKEKTKEDPTIEGLQGLIDVNEKLSGEQLLNKIKTLMENRGD